MDVIFVWFSSLFYAISVNGKQSNKQLRLLIVYWIEDSGRLKGDWIKLVKGFLKEDDLIFIHASEKNITEIKEESKGKIAITIV